MQMVLNSAEHSDIDEMIFGNDEEAFRKHSRK